MNASARFLGRINWLVLLALVMVGELACYAELRCRVWAATHYPRQRYLPDPILGFRMRPGSYNSPDRARAGWEINRDGIRGSDVPPDCDSGEVRILCLGDSLTSCLGVPLDQTYPAFLQRVLQAHCPEFRIRVINGGVDGYSLAQMAALMDELAPRYHVQIVVAMLLHGGQVYQPPPASRRWRLMLHRWTYQSQLVQMAMLRMRKARGFNNWPSEIMSPCKTSADSLMINLRDMYRRADARGIHLLVAVEPYTERLLRPHQNLFVPPPLGADERAAIQAQTDRRGRTAVWIDEAPEIRAAGTALLQPGDFHLNASGNQVMARLIGRRIRRRGWISGKAPREAAHP